MDTRYWKVSPVPLRLPASPHQAHSAPTVPHSRHQVVQLQTEHLAEREALGRDRDRTSHEWSDLSARRKQLEDDNAVLGTKVLGLPGVWLRGSGAGGLVQGAPLSSGHTKE